MKGEEKVQMGHSFKEEITHYMVKILNACSRQQYLALNWLK